MRRNDPANPLRSRRARINRLTLTDPWGECDLLWRNPEMTSFPLLDTTIDGWYGFRALEKASLDRPDLDGSETPRMTAAPLLLFYGLRSLAAVSDPVARLSLSGVLVEPSRSDPLKGTRRVTISLGMNGGPRPRPYAASLEESGYAPLSTSCAAFRTLGLIAGEVDSSRPDLYSVRPMFAAIQLEGMGFPCGGYRAMITEPAS